MRFCNLFFVGVLVLAAGLAAADAPKQQQIPFTAFRLVRTRNIFDPDRRPMASEAGPAAPHSAPPASPSDYVALTGTLVTGDKAFAFFTGSRPEFNAVLAVSGTVANIRVTQITPAQVKVNRDGKPIVIAVGQQLPLDGSTPVAMVAAPDSQPSPPAATSQDSGQENLIRRMMERRQRETSR